MKSRVLPILAGIAALFGASVAPSQAQQQFFADRLITPTSNSSRPEDLGRRAHTNYHALRTTRVSHSGAQPMWGTGPGGGMAPSQVYGFYGVKPPKKGFLGKNVIAIIDAYHLSTSLDDFNSFATQFGLPQEDSGDPTLSSNKVFQVVFEGGVQPPDADTYGWGLEEALDIEWAHAMAPNAKIILFEAQSNYYSDLMATVDLAVGTKGVKEVSMSWGGGEFSGETAYDVHFPTGQGIEFFAATGDGGAWPAYGYYPIYPSTCPNVIACGGTSVAQDPITTSYLYQIPWGTYPGWGGGGGPSSVEPKPSYQNGILHTDPTYRSTPDISAIADPFTGAAVYESAYSGWVVVGGTSLATPVLAGLSNAAGHFHADSATELSLLYANPHIGITDIEYGSNGYFALPGYDFASGLGIPKGLSGL